MKRREFVTSLVVMGCTALVPLPKNPASDHYLHMDYNDLTPSSDLTPEMLDEAFEYFAKEVVEHIRVCYVRDKKIMDMFDKLKEKQDGKNKKRNKTHRSEKPLR